MTPAEHYAESERLIRLITEADGTTEAEVTRWEFATIAIAQVHATLATVADAS